MFVRGIDKMIMKIDGVNLPVRKTKGSCGYDIECPIDLCMTPGTWYNFDTGIQMEEGDIQDGCFAIVLPRSSTGFKYGLRLKNTAGIIDSSYTMDTIKASISVTEPASFLKGDRILQMIIVPYGIIDGETAPTEKRVGGIGSTN